MWLRRHNKTDTHNNSFYSKLQWINLWLHVCCVFNGNSAYQGFHCNCKLKSAKKFIQLLDLSLDQIRHFLHANYLAIFIMGIISKKNYQQILYFEYIDEIVYTVCSMLHNDNNENPDRHMIVHRWILAWIDMVATRFRIQLKNLEKVRSSMQWLANTNLSSAFTHTYNQIRFGLGLFPIYKAVYSPHYSSFRVYASWRVYTTTTIN